MRKPPIIKTDVIILQQADVQTSMYLNLYGTNVSAGFPSQSTDYLEAGS